jgi:hypothetical protein
VGNRQRPIAVIRLLGEKTAQSQIVIKGIFDIEGLEPLGIETDELRGDRYGLGVYVCGHRTSIESKTAAVICPDLAIGAMDYERPRPYLELSRTEPLLEIEPLSVKDFIGRDDALEVVGQNDGRVDWIRVNPFQSLSSCCLPVPF